MSAVAVTNEVRTPLLAGLKPQGYRQMTFAHSGRPRKQDIVAAVHVAAGGQFPDQPGVDRGLEFEVEALQRLVKGYR